MVTHYEPYFDEWKKHPFCGTPESEYTETTNNWEYVSCKKCLKMKDKAKKYVNQIEKDVLNDMRDFNNFIKEKYSND